jgi:hypothetical protein
MGSLCGFVTPWSCKLNQCYSRPVHQQALIDQSPLSRFAISAVIGITRGFAWQSLRLNSDSGIRNRFNQRQGMLECLGIALGGKRARERIIVAYHDVCAAGVDSLGGRALLASVADYK